MNHKELLYLLFILLFATIVFAKDITISVNQSDYYFLIGEDSIVPLEVYNTYGKQIDGMLIYTVTQEINQGGFHYSSTDTQSNSFSVDEGEQTINLGFGTSDQPLTLRVDLSFDYNEKEQRTVDLDEILIHFVSDESQKKNKENRQQCSSEKAEQQSQQQSSIQQQMQEQMDKMLSQQSQQRVQNNQMDQDSSALKQQMQKQLEEQKRMQEQFKEQLEQNPEFQKEHQQLLDQGYKQSSANIDPINNSSGDFEVNYEKEGETASLKGSMENGEIKEMQRQSSEDAKKIMEELKKNGQFQKYDQQLSEEGFQQLDSEVIQQGNQTNVRVSYQNENNETAAINALIEDNEIKKVELEREKNRFWIWLLLIVLLITGFFFYKKYFKKEISNAKKIIEKRVDYKKEALRILEEAKELFRKGKEKDAYGKAGEAIRFYYSYKLGIKKELTNTELIKNLKKNKIKYQDTQKCLNLCGLVEFAKYKTNKKDFDMIVGLGEGIIK